jgi:TetR/AcrR family transcriptional repressor of mexCD-oprJ operon
MPRLSASDRSERPAATRPPLQQRVAASILDGAARVLAERGADASMADVAAAAGVARATVYRYFPNRQALLDELAQLAVADAGARLRAARVDQLETRVALERAARALVEVGDPIVAIAREHVLPDGVQFERQLAKPLRQIFERGQKAGEIRDDVPVEWLPDLLVACVVTALRAAPSLGRDDTTALVSGLFLDGARGRPRLAAVEGDVVSRGGGAERTRT